MADRRRNSPPPTLAGWMNSHYAELRPDQPMRTEWLRERVRELGIKDRAGKHPSDTCLRMTWSRVKRERQKREAERQADKPPVPARLPNYAPPPVTTRTALRPFAVVNPVRLETAPVTAERPTFRLAKMKGSES